MPKTTLAPCPASLEVLTIYVFSCPSPPCPTPFAIPRLRYHILLFRLTRKWCPLLLFLCHNDSKKNMGVFHDVLHLHLQARMQEMKEKDIHLGNGDANSHICKVCFESPTAAMLLPCRHFCCKMLF